MLESPLYYAAKWGGFTDTDNNDKPNLREEWDVRDANGEFTPDVNPVDGVPDGDAVPDNYFFVSNPAALEDALTAVFDIIIERVSSGTAAAVVANDQEGVGAVFQALYDPFKSDSTAHRMKRNGSVRYMRCGSIRKALFAKTMIRTANSTVMTSIM